MTWPNAAEVLAPLGYRPYRPAPHGTDIVPLYAPGLPMVMAIFKLLGGPRAVFLVVPLLGGLAIWATYLMGRGLAGPLVGASAAILLASSPPFLFEIVSPTSDVPATAWWALALGLLMVEGRAARLRRRPGDRARHPDATEHRRPRGCPWRPTRVAGPSFHTSPPFCPSHPSCPSRPSRPFPPFPPLLPFLPFPPLLPFLPFPPLLPSYPPTRAQVSAQRSACLLFAAGSIPACLAVALINWRLYGSPLASGYAPFAVLFNWSHVWPNLARYPRWLLETETPFVLPSR